MNLLRMMKHLTTPPWWVHVRFPPHTMNKIEEAIRASEKAHRGEIRFVVEASLDFPHLLRKLSPRARALDVFSHMRIWDTEENNGVLIYVLLVDHKVEIIADRGVHRKLEQHEWDHICRRMETAFRQGKFEEGAVEGVRLVGEHLMRHFPGEGGGPNELPDRPVIL